MDNIIEKTGLIYKKMVAIMAEADPIKKTRTNVKQGYQFRGIDEVYAALQLVFVKHGVFTVPRVLSAQRAEKQTASGGILLYSILDIEYDFVAEDGSKITARVIGEGMDSGDKASNKAMSVAHKYALLQVLMVPTNEAKDPEAFELPEIVKGRPRINPVQPEQPEPGNGNSSIDPEKIQYGQYAGRRPSEIDKDELLEYASKLETKRSKDAKLKNDPRVSETLGIIASYFVKQDSEFERSEGIRLT